MNKPWSPSGKEWSFSLPPENPPEGENPDPGGMGFPWWLRYHPFWRWPRISWTLLLICLIPLAWNFRGLPFATGIHALLQDNPLHAHTYDQLVGLSPVDNMVLFNISSDDSFAPASLRFVRLLSNAMLAADEGAERELFPVSGIKSLSHAVIPVRRGFRLGLDPLLPRRPLTERERIELREMALEHPLIRNILVSADGRHTLLTIELREGDQSADAWAERRDRIVAILESLEGERPPDLQVDFMSLPLAVQEVIDLAWGDVQRLLLWGAGLTILLLLPILRSFRLLFYLIISQLLFFTLLLLALQVSGIALSPYGFTVFPILGTIQLALLIHLAWGLRQEARRGGHPREAVGRTLSRLGKSCLFAALTTSGALFSFWGAEMTEVRQMGIVGGSGVLGGFLLAFGPGVTFLLFGCPRFRRPAPGKDQNRNPATASRDASGGALTRRVAWISLLVLWGSALPGYILLRPDIQLTRFLDEKTTIGRLLKIFEESYGGYTMLRIEIDTGRSGGVNDPQFLVWLNEREQGIASMTGISATYSYPLVLSLLNEIWEGGGKENRTLPETMLKRNLFVSALRTQADFPLFRLLVDQSWRKSYLYLRSRDLSGAEYLELVRQVEAHLEENRPSRVTISVEEGMQTILAAERRITQAQLRSALWSLLVVGVMLFLFWRSAKLALLAVASVAYSLILLLGWAAYTGLLLNASTVLAITVVFGVAIDDIVHLLTSWRKRIDEGWAPGPALRESWRIKGPAILTTTLVLSAVFSLFAGSVFPPVRELGLLLASGFVLVLLAVLVGPWLVLTAPRPDPKSPQPREN